MTGRHETPPCSGLYDAPDRYGLNQSTVELYRAQSKEEFRAALSQEGADPDELKGFGETVAAFYAGHTSYDYEADEIACDGTPIRTHIRFAMAPRHRDDWSRVLVSIEDITFRKQAEERLQQAQKMEAVGQLTGGVAHDFNNLLAVIQGNAELLAAGAEDDEGSLTRPLLRAARRGAELTQRLLAFSRRQPLHPQEIDFGELVDGMTELLSRTLGETIRIGTVAQPGLWTASADPGQVENAILNLAINARDAMPGGGKLTIECENARLDEGYVGQNPEALVGDYVVLSVSDSGTGMTTEVREHAFEPFFTTQEVGKGSGLGLSMVYGFAKQSGGHVIIYSEEGEGTTIRLYLPRAVQPSEAKEVPTALERMPRGQGETVLVLEDDPDVRQLAVKLVASLGYQVIDVPEAASARAVLDRGERLDLLLSDVVLPGGTSGPEFAEEARERFPDLKVIFMSGYAAEAAKRNGFLDSDKVLLNKPFQRSQLAEALFEALD